MSLLDAARRLLSGYTDGDCIWCEVIIDVPHRPDCPILALPLIIAALEAAERVVADFDHDAVGGALALSLDALVAALRRDEATAMSDLEWKAPADLSGLREDWYLSRTERGWQVSRMGYEELDYLAEAATIPQAIEAAGLALEVREREQEARNRDYQERKAAGKLTFMELAAEYTAGLWSKAVFEQMGAGDEVRIPSLPDYEPFTIRVKEPPGER